MADYIEPLPVTVIAELLGIPEADRHLLRPWSRDICLMYELDPPEASARKAVAASLAFSAYLRDLAPERREAPRDDLISALVAASLDGDRLTEDESIGTCVLLLNAGHEASVNGAANGWWSLFRHPGELARLRAEPDLAATAIDELLRFDTPLALFERYVLEDIEVAGVRCRAVRRWPSSSRRRTAIRPRSRSRIGSTWGAIRTRTCRSARGSTTAWGRRSARMELQIAFAIVAAPLARPGTRRDPAVEADIRASRYCRPSGCGS